MRVVEVGALLDQAAEGSDKLTDDTLRNLFADVTGLEPDRRSDAWETMEDAVLGSHPDGTGLHVRPGGWVVDIRSSAVRTVLAAAIVGGAMWVGGLDQLPGHVLPAVLPLLVDVRRTRLSRADNRLLIDLRLSQTAAQTGWPWPADALYGRLPPEIQARVHQGDFADFIDRLVQVGEADPAGYDEVKLRPAGRPAWIRINVQ